MNQLAQSNGIRGRTSHGRFWLALCVPAFLLFAVALTLVPCAAAGTADSRPARASSAHVATPLTIADFDGDQRPDLVSADIGQQIASRTVYKIAIELSSGARSTLNLAAPEGGLQLASRDVNGDDLLDVVVTTAWTSRPVAVLLNDGQGNFTELSPEQFPGVFPDSGSTLDATNTEIRDSLGATLPRYESIALKPLALIDSVYLARLQIPDSFCFSLVCRNGSFLGRAPPLSILSI
ncbi:MAG: VCBS repeat-containing protein [Acidobacteria bacterium]|nr:VCBS repeat-containing protein [Acidobacteriota bacterium]